MLYGFNDMYGIPEKAELRKAQRSVVSWDLVCGEDEQMSAGDSQASETPG